MSKVIPFKKPKATDKAKGRTLCKHGFHKWEIWKNKQFDVKAGKLVTVYRCKRCDAVKSKTL